MDTGLDEPMATQGRPIPNRVQNAIERAIHQYQRGIRETARDLEVARNTVRKYCRKHNEEAQQKPPENTSENS